jgi:hypothetical protein
MASLTGRRSRRLIAISLAGVAAATSLGATSARAQAAAPAEPAAIPKLFASEAPLALTLTSNVRALRGDKSETAPYRAATITYAGSDGKRVTVPVRVKTHGIWRLKHCEFPPLRLNFSNKETKHTLLHDLEKPKLVSTCYDKSDYEQLVLKEFQLYRIYQLLTPASHRARLLRITYADSASGKDLATRYAFLFEDPDQLAERLGGHMVKVKGATAEDLDARQAAIAYLFEYFIGNTDFSFNGLHNGEVVGKSDGSNLIPVAYDFDFSGAVNAPYATVDPALSVKRVRDRLFRGYCALGAEYPAALALLVAKKDAIYALYHDDVGRLMDPNIVKESLEYFDDFYDGVRNTRDAARILDSCVGRR